MVRLMNLDTIKVQIYRVGFFLFFFCFSFFLCGGGGEFRFSHFSQNLLN